MIRVTCETCGKTTQAPEHYEGRRAKCSSCGGTIVVTQPAAAPAGGGASSTGPQPKPPASSAGGRAKRSASIPCRVCDQGNMVRKRVHRLGAAAVLGYVVLIPSVIGVASGVALVADGSIYGWGFAGDPPAGGTQALLHALFSFGWLVFWFLGLVLSAVLVRKKRVLRCPTCGATVEVFRLRGRLRSSRPIVGGVRR